MNQIYHFGRTNPSESCPTGKSYKIWSFGNDEMICIKIGAKKIILDIDEAEILRDSLNKFLEES